MRKKLYLSSALLPGIILGELSVIPHIRTCNFCCFVWVVLGGALSAMLFARENREIKAGQGAITGFLAGIIGALVSLVGSILLEFVFKAGSAIEIQNILSESEIDPIVENILTNVFANPWLTISMNFIGWLVINSIMATLGGLLAGAIIEKRRSKKK